MKRLLPELIADYRNRWRELRQQFRQWRSGERSEADSVVRRSGVAAAVATIREATKVALVVAAIGLLFVGLALVLRQNPAEKVSLRIIVEYYAALLFFRPRLRSRHPLRLAPGHHRPLLGRHRGGDPLCHRVGRPWPVHPRRRTGRDGEGGAAVPPTPKSTVETPAQLPDRRGPHQGPLCRPLRLLRPSVPGGHAHWPGARGRLVLRTLHPFLLPSRLTGLRGWCRIEAMR